MAILDFEESGETTPNPPAIVIGRPDTPDPEDGHEDTTVPPVSVTPASDPTPRADPAASGGDPESTGGDDSAARARDDAGRFVKQPEERHRAKSQRASPEDVPRIQRITETLRETQVRLALKDGITDVDQIINEVYPEATDEQKKQNRGKIEKIVAKYAPKTKAEPAKLNLPPKVETPADPAAFAKPKPKFAEYDDLEKFTDDMVAWRLEADAHAKQQAAETSKSAEAQKAAKDWETQTMSTWQARCQAFEQTHPDFKQVVADANVQLSDVMRLAILLDANGPAVLRSLSQHSDEADSCYFDTASLPVTDAHVALVQRRLSKLLAAGSTGAAPASVIVNRQPKPPTPVRTGPMKTGDEPPDDDASYEEHVKAFPIRRAVRR